MSEETIFALICKLRACEFVYEVVKEKEKEKTLVYQNEVNGIDQY